MRILTLSCHPGFTVEALLAALIDAGADPAKIERIVGHGFHIEANRGAAGTWVSCGVEADADSDLASLPLTPYLRGVVDRATDRLRDARPGSLVDQPGNEHGLILAATAAALHIVGIEKTYADPLPLPTDAPTTLIQLARGAMLRFQAGPPPSPAAVAFVSALVGEWRTPGPIRLIAAGSGQARVDAEDVEKVRAVIGDIDTITEERSVSVIETNIDDMPATNLEYVMAMLFRQGALDVFFTPIQMKKNRPAVMLSVLCAESTTKACVEVILRETTSLGVRIFHADRICLERRMLEAETPFGIVPVKAAIYEGQVRSLSPEYDVCRRLCEASGVPLRVVQDAAVDAARGRSDDMG